MTGHPLLVFTVRVGYTTQRPVVPDQHTTHVLVAAQTDTEARLVACEMVGARRGVVMVTRATVLDVVA